MTAAVIDREGMAMGGYIDMDLSATGAARVPEAFEPAPGTSSTGPVAAYAATAPISGLAMACGRAFAVCEEAGDVDRHLISRYTPTRVGDYPGTAPLIRFFASPADPECERLSFTLSGCLDRIHHQSEPRPYSPWASLATAHVEDPDLVAAVVEAEAVRQLSPIRLPSSAPTSWAMWANRGQAHGSDATS